MAEYNPFNSTKRKRMEKMKETMPELLEEIQSDPEFWGPRLKSGSVTIREKDPYPEPKSFHTIDAEGGYVD